MPDQILLIPQTGELQRIHTENPEQIALNHKDGRQAILHVRTQDESPIKVLCVVGTDDPPNTPASMALALLAGVHVMFNSPVILMDLTDEQVSRIISTFSGAALTESGETHE